MSEHGNTYRNIHLRTVVDQSCHAGISKSPDHEWRCVFDFIYVVYIHYTLHLFYQLLRLPAILNWEANIFTSCLT